MTFGAPEWFWGFLLLPVLLGVFLRNEVRREQLLRKLVAARLLPDLVASTSAPRRRSRFALALLGLACVIAALTQPRVGYEILETHRKGLDLLIAVDTSRSMLSTDVQPDRLTRAKYAAQDLVDSLEGDRAGLIAFAGTSFVQAPLTIDYSAVATSITDLDTNTIPRGGTNIASAIRQAADAFGKGESAYRALVLFTDGEELEDDAVRAAKEVAGQFKIFTVGVGTPEGSLIPAPGAEGGTDFVKDADGKFVKSRLDETRLKAIAQATGGFYIHLESGPATAKAIIEEGLGKMKEHEFQARETRPIERYEWPLGAGILLLLASVLIRERRRVSSTRRNQGAAGRPARQTAETAAVAVALLLLLMPVRGWSKNEGLDLYDQKNYKGAYDVFQQQLERNPTSDGLEFDGGAAAYKKGDYDKALESFGKVLGSKDQSLREQAEYNLGNTLVQRGALHEQKDQKIKEWTAALKHYDEALKVDPKNGDAKYNEDVVRKMIDELNKKEQQQQNQQQQNQQQQNQQQQNQQQQNQQQQNQQQQNQQQQNQQQQNQQQQNQQQQNQQQQNQQQQNQQQQNQQQQNRQQQNQQQQNQQQQNRQQQKAGGQGQQDQQHQGSGPGQQNQQQTGQQKPDEQNQGSGDQRQSMNATSPSPTPGNGQGTIKEQSQKDQQSDAQAAARAATEQASTGEMTPSQAQALIDSLRGEDEHVSLYDRHQNNTEADFKDW